MGAAVKRAKYYTYFAFPFISVVNSVVFEAIYYTKYALSRKSNNQILISARKHQLIVEQRF